MPPTRTTVLESAATVRGISLSRWADSKPNTKAFLQGYEFFYLILSILPNSISIYVIASFTSCHRISSHLMICLIIPCLTILESEWKALSRCRRVWAAMALAAILKGQTSLTDISSVFECEVGELEDLKRSAKVMVAV